MRSSTTEPRLQPLCLQSNTALQILRRNLDDHPPRNSTGLQILQRLLDILHSPRFDFALDQPSSSERESFLRIGNGADHAAYKFEAFGNELGGV